MELNDSTPLARQWRDETDSEPEFGKKFFRALQLECQPRTAVALTCERFVKVLNSSVEIRVEIHFARFSSPVIPHLSALCTISVQRIALPKYFLRSVSCAARRKNIFVEKERANPVWQGKISGFNTSAAAGRA
jgi:hypothetical protein